MRRLAKRKKERVLFVGESTMRQPAYKRFLRISLSNGGSKYTVVILLPLQQLVMSLLRPASFLKLCCKAISGPGLLASSTKVVLTFDGRQPERASGIGRLARA